MSGSRLIFAALAAASLFLSGCDRFGLAMPKAPPKKTEAAAAPAPAIGTLEWAASGPWRIDPERDRWRHPVETLKFYGVAPGMTVVEVFPGRGWFTSVLAPYLARNNGRLIVASFDPATATDSQKQTLEEFGATFVGKPEPFGDVAIGVLSPRSAGIAPDGTADLVIVSRNVHTLLGDGFAEKAFADFYKVLKPGGILGIEQHRARSTGLQDPQASNGYVQEAFVKMLAEEAGFEFVGSSEINANPRDDRDHPFGVWTLPPTLRTAPIGQDPDPRFDSAPYRAIGESDRMTLKFRKPGGEVAPTDAPPVAPAAPETKK
jgi:predicted methyltransferase